MAAFLLRRLVLTIPIVLIVSVVVFSLLHFLPGDPAVLILGQEATPQALATLRAQLGLDQPLPVQYIRWLGNLLRGDLGRSLITNQPVLDIILSKMPPTLELAIGAFLTSVLIAVPAGIVSATRRGRFPDYVATTFAFAGLSIPHFWLGIMLLLLFAVQLKWLPASGYVPIWENPGQNLKVMILPMIATGMRESAIVTRQLRSSLLEVLGQDYIRTARSKGLSEATTILRHGLRNALIPLVTLLAFEIPLLFGGALYTETIFAWPGMGRLFYERAVKGDMPVVMALVIIFSALTILAMFLADVAYTVLDPRIQLGKRKTA